MNDKVTHSCDHLALAATPAIHMLYLIDRRCDVLPSCITVHVEGFAIKLAAIDVAVYV